MPTSRARQSRWIRGQKRTLYKNDICRGPRRAHGLDGCFCRLSNAAEMCHTRWFEFGKNDGSFERMSSQLKENPTIIDSIKDGALRSNVDCRPRLHYCERRAAPQKYAKASVAGPQSLSKLTKKDASFHTAVVPRERRIRTEWRTDTRKNR